MRYLSVLPTALWLGACATLPQQTPVEPLEPLNPDVIRPLARPSNLNTTPAPTPPPTARTVEDFDTTTAEDRAAAVNTDADTGGEKTLGNTVASLGDPTKPGFWLETPLVSSPRAGRVVSNETGKEVLVDLIPIDGPATAGSRISLAAMRLLGVSLAGLPELQVFGR